MDKHLNAQHGVVCRLPGERMSYFGWPGLARLEDGTLLVTSSGLRSAHVCPWGKTVLNVSRDGGQTWSAPRVINDSPLDDRDTGLLHLGGGRLLVTWFTADTSEYAHMDWVRDWLGAQEVEDWKVTLAGWTPDVLARWLGSWLMLSADRGESWGPPLRTPVSSPNGPALLANGDLLYLGKDATEMRDGRIKAALSRDGGQTWEIAGTVPMVAGTTAGNYHEPHVVELPDGRLLGMIRIENAPDCDLAGLGLVNFSLMQTMSADGGCSWSEPRPLGFHGSPPNLLRHSDGTIVCVYGFREEGFGQRAMLSYDNGATWQHDWILRADGLDFDLGYPKSVEMDDGSIFTVYYQRLPGDQRCSLLWTRWRLPDKE